MCTNKSHNHDTASVAQHIDSMLAEMDPLYGASPAIVQAFKPQLDNDLSLDPDAGEVIPRHPQAEIMTRRTRH